ncbi:DNRLRE domain-containing protein [Micromonosporaceae bacterium DT55]|uniref:DNRLRE domain-containing protein n=1 Tax=Melissospora conviva TaxID=3388432 RepID=UPI003C1E7BCD
MPPSRYPALPGSTQAPSRRPRESFAALLAGTLTATAAVVVAASPAAAGVWEYVRPVSVNYTDSRQPDTSFPADNDFPVGKWQSDTGMHTSQAYLTFDLAPYQGKTIIEAGADTGETAVTDCERPREVEIWRTADPSSAPTWNDAPATEAKVGDVGAGYAICPAPRLEIDLADALQDALDEGKEQVTFLLRIKGDHQDNPQHGRRLKPIGVSIKANAAPHAPTQLRVDNRDCAEGLFTTSRTPTLSARITDPDSRDGWAGDLVTATFAYWPADRPDERTEWESSRYYAPTPLQYRVPQSLPDGRYAFAVKAADEHAASDWSPACEFTLDATPPAIPTVTSTDYPEGSWQGGPFIPGTFTFTADSDDLAGFRYGEIGPTDFVAVDEGSRSVDVTIAPTSDGPGTLYVWSVDKAGNRSGQTYYRFLVRPTAPFITDANPSARIGEPRELTFSPRMDNVVEYTYRFNDDDPVTVPAGADGTTTVTVVPRRPGMNQITVTSRTSGGLPSGISRLDIYLVTQPSVSSVEYPIGGRTGAPTGTPGTFVFRPGMPDTVEYIWSVNRGPQQTVAAQPDGTASVVYTPTKSGYHTLQVDSRSSDGTVSETANVSFQVASHAPTVESATYPEYSAAGGPGVAGDFTFRPASEGVTGYVYSFGEQEETVQAAGDGSATITWTPRSYPTETSGWVTLTVRAVVGSIVSDPTEYMFMLLPLAPTVTGEDFPPSGGGAGAGTPGEFTLTAAMPGTTEFVYRWRGGEHTVAAGPDGTATITLTPESEGSHYLYVSSRSADGVTSGEMYHYFYVG